MSTPDQQKAAKTANALLKKDINNEDVEQGLIPLILDMFTRHQKTMKAFQDYAKKQVMDGVKVDGWFLKPGLASAPSPNSSNSTSIWPRSTTAMPKPSGSTAPSIPRGSKRSSRTGWKSAPLPMLLSARWTNWSSNSGRARSTPPA